MTIDQGDIFTFQDIKNVRQVIVISNNSFNDSSFVSVIPIKEVITKYFKRKKKAICIKDASVVPKKYLLEKIGSLNNQELKVIYEKTQCYGELDIILNTFNI